MLPHVILEELMGQSDEVIWELKPHSQAKHEILKRYLGAWFGILGGKFPQLIYIDGFAGPGLYKKGEPGSPIIALKIAQTVKDNQRLQKVKFLFVEKSRPRVDQLREEIKLLSLSTDFEIRVEEGKFEVVITDFLSHPSERTPKTTPAFVFIDPFGFEGVPFEIVSKILSYPNSEVFINLALESVNRFVGHPSQAITQNMVDLFGTPEVLKLDNCSNNRVGELRSLYQKQLEAVK